MVSSGCSATTCAIPERTPAAVDASTLTIPLSIEERRSYSALFPPYPAPPFPGREPAPLLCQTRSYVEFLGPPQEFGRG